jgi:hypothetical protein
MRVLILIAGALTLAACGKSDQTDNMQSIDENFTAENIVSNDVTAIDAVTGDAANMAAESRIGDLGDVSNDSGNASAFPKPKPKPQTVAPSPEKAPPPAASNLAANSASNSTD